MDKPSRGAEKGFREIGVVEGFYGPLWSADERFDLIEALLPAGLNTYLYCPKHEPALGRKVMEGLAPADSARLEALARFCRARKIAPWAGLHLEPPFDPANSQHLELAAKKCSLLAGLGYSGMALLLDDLPASPPENRAGINPAESEPFAKIQAKAISGIVKGVQSQGIAVDWLVCPALYSLDPILEKEYGPYEENYLANLDQGLPAGVGWLWTGARVVSPTVTLADLAAWRGETARETTREIVLWDNYPVNDAAMSESLHLGPLTGRAPDLPSGLRGYFFNPLLQPALGKLPGATALAYADNPGGYSPDEAWQTALEEHLPENVREAFRGLEALTRHSRLAGLPQDKGPPAATLGKRLEAGWRNFRAGKPLDNEVVAELLEILENLTENLPAEMRKEAAPWLERLGLAHKILARAAASGKSFQSAAAEYNQGQARVLGEWFDP